MFVASQHIVHGVIHRKFKVDVIGILKHHNVILLELETPQASPDDLDIRHGLINVLEAFKAFLLSLLGVVTAPDHDRFLLVHLEKLFHGNPHEVASVYHLFLSWQKFLL